MEPLFDITLLRHGESEGNQAGLLQGQTDPPLTPAGARQAQALADYWRAQGTAFDQIISSPLQRARQTAERIATALDAPIECDPAWMERNFGLLEGLPFASVRQHQPPVDFYHPYQAIGEHGESALDVSIRAGLALQSLLRRPPGRYLVVSHGAFLNMVLYAVIGLTPQGHYHSPRFYFSNTGYSELTYRPALRQWRFHSFNCLPHWQAAGLPDDPRAQERGGS